MERILKRTAALALLSAAAFAQAVAEGSIGQLANGRIVLAGQRKVFEMASKTPQKDQPRQIDSIAWSPDGSGIIFDMQGGNGFFGIAIADPGKDGQASPRSLTANRGDGRARLNNSAPCFHPDGIHYVFSGQDEGSSEYRNTLPGIGLYSNLLLSDVNSSQYIPLTDEISSVRIAKGACCPRFSPDGGQLAWISVSRPVRESSLWGTRVIKVAGFSGANGTPRIQGAKTYTPSAAAEPFYEIYGFTRDGKSLLFATNLDKDQKWFGMDICVLDLRTRKARNLNNTPDVWDRYAALSPDGGKIVWSSSSSYSLAFLGYGGSKWRSEMLSELWIMNADGSDKRQLSFFNVRGHEHYAGGSSFIGGLAWHPRNPGKIAFILHTRQASGYNSSAIIVAELAGGLPGRRQ